VKIALCFLLALCATLARAEPTPTVEIDAFIARTAMAQSLDAGWIRNVLAGAIYRQDIIDAMNRPAEAKPWWRYRPIFVTEQRIEAGLAYWRLHHDALSRAEREYGVPPEVILAIIGVETLYGRNTGRHRVLDALYTLAFHYPKRAPFFQDELAAMLRMTRDEHLDPATLNGSYAGAMGRPQFMPSSFRAYAVDFDGDGRKDIWTDDDDVIGSVAHYLAKHGWQRGQQIALPVGGVDARHRPFVDAGLKPSMPWRELQSAGIRTATPPPLPDTLASLIELGLEHGAEYWIGLNNFYVITRYNHSALYAMAAYQLSRELRQRHGG
jgi:membrane-bound lytic murein transglycosylase B